MEKSPQQIWFTSDTHFGHKNILKYCDRPASNIDEMNETIIKQWNACVGPEDIVYHLGDFGFCGVTKAHDILSQLKGTKRLVYGNHDRGFLKKSTFLQHWEWIRTYHSFRWEGTRICLFHFPIAAWDEQGKGSWHLHGHSHGSYRVPGKILDVGIDGPFGTSLNTMQPLALSTIESYMKTRPIHVGDGHHNHEGDSQ